MANKEEKEEPQPQPKIRMMSLSSSFSNNRYIFYSSLRILNSLMITSSALWYSHYYLIRTDDDKSNSYFSPKSETPQTIKSTNHHSKQRLFCQKIAQCSLLFCIANNILSKIKKYSLTKLLTNIKSSHFSKKKRKKNSKNNQKGPIYLKQCDLRLLDKWKSLLGGNKYYLGSLDTSVLLTLYSTLLSETTLFQNWIIGIKYADNNESDWKDRYFQFEDETQEIQWTANTDDLNKQKNIPNQTVPIIGKSINNPNTVVFSSIALTSVGSLILSYNLFPVSTICAFSVFKCGLNIEHRLECNSFVWWNKGLCIIAISRIIFMGIINKLHFLRYFAIRDVSIATYKKYIIFGNKKKNSQKSIGDKKKLERRVRNLLSLRSFTYDFVYIFPWICLYVSCSATQSSTYYIKSFASSWFYGLFSKRKHEKNRYLLKMIAVTSLMVGVCVGIGNETYFESVKYAKRWFMDRDQYSIESYQSKKKVRQIIDEEDKMDMINENDSKLTPGFANIAMDMKEKELIDMKDEESDQVEGEGNVNDMTPRYTRLQQKLINSAYQQDSEMLLSKRYFRQKANDLFEYFTEICVFLEDKFLNALIIPVY